MFSRASILNNAEYVLIKIRVINPRFSLCEPKVVDRIGESLGSGEVFPTLLCGPNRSCLWSSAFYLSPSPQCSIKSQEISVVPPIGC